MHCPAVGSSCPQKAGERRGLPVEDVVLMVPAARRIPGIHGQGEGRHPWSQTFGFRQATSKKQCKSMGARLRKPGADRSRQQPLACVFIKMHKWLTHERRYGQEVKHQNITSRFIRELQTDKGRQEVLREKGSPNFNQRILDAVSTRITRMDDHTDKGTKPARE